MFVLVRARVCGIRAFSLGRPFGCSPHQIGSRQMLRKVAAPPRRLPASLYLPKLGPQNQARSYNPAGPGSRTTPAGSPSPLLPGPRSSPRPPPAPPGRPPSPGPRFRAVRLIPCGGGALGGGPLSAPFGSRAVCPRSRLVRCGRLASFGGETGLRPENGSANPRKRLSASPGPPQ